MDERSDGLQALSIGQAFPAESTAGRWVLVLCMAVNDLVTLDGAIHDAMDEEGPESGYFLRILCGTLRELWRLFQTAEEEQGVIDLIDDFPEEAAHEYETVKSLFLRPAPESKSWAEEHLKGVRDRTFHYPAVHGPELTDVLVDVADEHARLRESGPRPFDFADEISLLLSFGDLRNPQNSARLNDIITKAKEIEEALVPVVWSALGSHLRALGLEPRRLEAEGDGE